MRALSTEPGCLVVRVNRAVADVSLTCVECESFGCLLGTARSAEYIVGLTLLGVWVILILFTFFAQRWPINTYS